MRNEQHFGLLFYVTVSFLLLCTALDTKNFKSWTSSEVSEWLEGIVPGESASAGEGAYHVAFRENDVDGAILADLDSEDLAVLAVSADDATTILDAVGGLEVAIGGTKKSKTAKKKSGRGRRRRKLTLPADLPPIEVVSRDDVDALFGGSFENHFGHTFGAGAGAGAGGPGQADSASFGGGAGASFGGGNPFGGSGGGGGDGSASGSSGGSDVNKHENGGEGGAGGAEAVFGGGDPFGGGASFGGGDPFGDSAMDSIDVAFGGAGTHISSLTGGLQQTQGGGGGDNDVLGDGGTGGDEQGRKGKQRGRGGGGKGGARSRRGTSGSATSSSSAGGETGGGGGGSDGASSTSDSASGDRPSGGALSGDGGGGGEAPLPNPHAEARQKKAAALLALSEGHRSPMLHDGMATVLSDRPRVFAFDNFITPEEADYIRSLPQVDLDDDANVPSDGGGAESPPPAKAAAPSSASAVQGEEGEEGPFIDADGNGIDAFGNTVPLPLKETGGKKEAKEATAKSKKEEEEETGDSGSGGGGASGATTEAAEEKEAAAAKSSSSKKTAAGGQVGKGGKRAKANTLRHTTHLMSHDKKDKKESVVRSSSFTFLNISQEYGDAVVNRTRHKMAHAMRYPFDTFEKLQVHRYAKGDFYNSHLDSEEGVENKRVATLIIYLSDEEHDGLEGGDTVFPLASSRSSGRWANFKPTKSSLMYGQQHWADICADPDVFRVKPKKGMALLFFPLRTTGDVDPLSLHASCPVTKGEKWIAQQWVHQLPIDIRANPAVEALFLLQRAPAAAAAAADAAPLVTTPVTTPDSDSVVEVTPTPHAPDDSDHLAASAAAAVAGDAAAASPALDDNAAAAAVETAEKESGASGLVAVSKSSSSSTAEKDSSSGFIPDASGRGNHMIVIKGTSTDFLSQGVAFAGGYTACTAPPGPDGAHLMEHVKRSHGLTLAFWVRLASIDADEDDTPGGGKKGGAAGGDKDGGGKLQDGSSSKALSGSGSKERERGGGSGGGSTLVTISSSVDHRTKKSFDSSTGFRFRIWLKGRDLHFEGPSSNMRRKYNFEQKANLKAKTWYHVGMVISALHKNTDKYDDVVKAWSFNSALVLNGQTIKVRQGKVPVTKFDWTTSSLCIGPQLPEGVAMHDIVFLSRCLTQTEFDRLYRPMVSKMQNASEDGGASVRTGPSKLTNNHFAPRKVGKGTKKKN